MWIHKINISLAYSFTFENGNIVNSHYQRTKTIVVTKKKVWKSLLIHYATPYVPFSGPMIPFFTVTNVCPFRFFNGHNQVHIFFLPSLFKSQPTLNTRLISFKMSNQEYFEKTELFLVCNDDVLSRVGFPKKPKYWETEGVLTSSLYF